MSELDYVWRRYVTLYNGLQHKNYKTLRSLCALLMIGLFLVRNRSKLRPNHHMSWWCSRFLSKPWALHTWVYICNETNTERINSNTQTKKRQSRNVHVRDDAKRIYWSWTMCVSLWITHRVRFIFCIVSSLLLSSRKSVPMRVSTTHESIIHTQWVCA